ncbi:MAG: DUF4915 domain-containing protein [Chloroflexi bacterium]|nr:DUF4915 domain-containing protein [Chloroflexota bacterium]
MPCLLVSFCNVFPRALALGIYDFDSCAFKWVELAGVGEPVGGATGLSRYHGGYACLVQLPTFCGASALVLLDQDLHLREVHRLVETGDAHSLAALEDGFLANDSLRNRLIRIDLSPDGKSVREVEFWRGSDEPRDVLHVNSVALLNGEPYVSLFGPGPGGDWEYARSGRILNTSADHVACNNLFHPHSLKNVDGTLCWLESRRGLVHRYSAELGHEVVAKLEGYVRGLAHDAQHLYVGASAIRRRPKGGGTPNVVGTLTPENSNSWLYRIDRQTLAVERRRLTAFSSEIYDVLVLEGFENTISFLDQEPDPVVRRMWSFEDEYLQAVGGLERSLSAASEQLVAAVSHRDDLLAAVSESDDLLARKDEQIARLSEQKARLETVERELVLAEESLRQHATKRDQHIADLQAALDGITRSRAWRMYLWVRRFLPVPGRWLQVETPVQANPRPSGDTPRGDSSPPLRYDPE